MNVALLNVRITVQKNEVVVDSIGNHKNTWTDWYSCYATVSSESPNEDTDAGMISWTTARWTLRFAGAGTLRRLPRINTE